MTPAWDPWLAIAFFIVVCVMVYLDVRKKDD